MTRRTAGGEGVGMGVSCSREENGFDCMSVASSHLGITGDETGGIQTGHVYVRTGLKYAF